MSRKVKSELSFIIKIFTLFIIMFASKINKSIPELSLKADRFFEKNVLTEKKHDSNISPNTL